MTAEADILFTGKEEPPRLGSMGCVALAAAPFLEYRLVGGGGLGKPVLERLVTLEAQSRQLFFDKRPVRRTVGVVT